MNYMEMYDMCKNSNGMHEIIMYIERESGCLIKIKDLSLYNRNKYKILNHMGYKQRIKDDL